MYERLKEARLYLNLSQEFVAKQIGVSRPAISSIESGKRKVSSSELRKFSEIYGVTTDELLYGKVNRSENTKIFTRKFSKLDEQDQEEILNLIEFKRKYKASFDE